MNELSSVQDGLVLVVFAIVYLGMVLGSLPWLHLDRTGVALLGAIAIVGAGVMTPEQAAQSIHLPTILLLFSFMVLSAQMRLGGFYSAVTRRIAALPVGPTALMGVVIVVAAGLSAVFSNDIVCLAVAPVLAEACLRRRLDPVPFLLGLACASNIGSAATLIGNPQNMLIGEVLRMPFAGYMRDAIVPVLAGLLALWLLLAWAMHRTPPVAEPDPAQLAALAPDASPFDRWQTAKGLLVALALVGVFLLTDWPREVAALAGAGLLLLSQRFHSSTVMGLIDWELLVLFMGLFVVNHALALTGLTQQLVVWLTVQGIDLAQPATLFFTTLGLSNLVSNVPAVMVLMPLAKGDHVGLTLALVSTLAGNLLIVGSIANLIVVDAARRCGIVIDWRRHARTGVPVAVVTLGIAAGWLAAR
ncbi:SLC13 family permease [Sphaerotilus sp.]|uniref:SLC13 family permease n=1 Tax=Sphaerotilus sp. TaxID=2093942 RepID=UPI0034E229BB